MIIIGVSTGTVQVLLRSRSGVPQLCLTTDAASSSSSSSSDDAAAHSPTWGRLRNDDEEAKDVFALPCLTDCKHGPTHAPCWLLCVVTTCHFYCVQTEFSVFVFGVAELKLKEPKQQETPAHPSFLHLTVWRTHRGDRSCRESSLILMVNI